MARRLHEHGIEVIKAVTGKQGYWKYLTGSPDVIITDLSMPEVNGVEIIESIRRSENGNELIPILVLSGMATLDMKNRLKHLGATAVLDKPAKTLDVLHEIHRAIA